MTAADKIADARALIEPLTGHTPGPWRAQWESEEYTYEVCRHHSRDTIEIVGRSHLDSNAALIAAAPALRDTVAALADLADAQAQEIAKLRSALTELYGAMHHEAGEIDRRLAMKDARAALGETP